MIPAKIKPKTSSVASSTSATTYSMTSEFVVAKMKPIKKKTKKKY